MNSLLKTALALVLTIVSGAAIAENEHPSEVKPTSDPSRSQPASAASPIQMLRTLQLMQDQIAVGSTEAHMGQRGLLTILDSRFMDLPPQTWEDGKNIRAAIAFVLSGGNPQILRKLLEMGNPAIPIEDRPLVEGTLAYVEGR